jgi:hypothetical protein
MKADPAGAYDEEPRLKLRWLVTLPAIDPWPIARDCMAAPMPLARRLALQVTGRTVIRDCCWHHGIDWHQASATAVAIARRLRREHVTDAYDLFDSAIDLTRDLSWGQQHAVLSLLSPGDGIMIGRLAGHRELSYQNGRKRTYTMLEAGVRRTVVIDWPE